MKTVGIAHPHTKLPEGASIDSDTPSKSINTVIFYLDTEIKFNEIHFQTPLI